MAFLHHNNVIHRDLKRCPPPPSLCPPRTTLLCTLLYSPIEAPLPRVEGMIGHCPECTRVHKVKHARRGHVPCWQALLFGTDVTPPPNTHT